MSVKIYYDDSYIQEFDGTVLSCRQGKKGWEIVLDRTAFYPEGGGQPHDTGLMWRERENPVKVLDVRERGEEIVHICDLPLPEGRKVHGKIDWDRRFDMMQQHTGEHIFSGVVHSLFGYNNVGFHLNEKETTVDFDGPMTKEDLELALERCRLRVRRAEPVTASFPDITNLEYRSKKELSGPVRIVRAGSRDMCACCGTHTATTRQAGPIIAPAMQNYKGGVRITLYCGDRAVRFSRRRSRDCYRISHALSAPLEKITGAVETKIAEAEALKISLREKENEIARLYLENNPAKEGIIAAVRDNLSSRELSSWVNLASGFAPVAAVLSPVKAEGNGQTSGRAAGLGIITRDEALAGLLGKHITGILGGKGGGKKGSWQGFTEKVTDRDGLFDIVSDFMKDYKN